jgi:predicted transposase YbfD/YdcC
MQRFKRIFAGLPDPRAANARHDLSEIIFIALLGMLAGCKSCCDIALFAKSKQDMLRGVLPLEHGVPSHDTFSRVFRLLDPKAFEGIFRRFIKAFAKANQSELKRGRQAPQVVAVDGKALKRAYARGKSHMPPVMVNAWAAGMRMALGGLLAPGNNEVEGFHKLINMLSLEGCIVTGDALHCRVDTARAIIRRGGDYALMLKGNRPLLLRAARAAIARARRAGARTATSRTTRHGRIENRSAIITSAAKMLETQAFPGLVAVACIRSRRGRGKTTERYMLLSRRLTARAALAVARDHWHVENRLHWRLDVVFAEDLARNRKDNGPENIALMRRIALNIVEAWPDQKTPLSAKIKRAGWDDAYLLDMIAHMR